MKDYIKNLYFFIVGCTVPTFFHYQNDIATYSMKAIEDVTTYACGDATSSSSSSSGRVELLQLPWGNNMKLATTRLGMATTAGSGASSSGSPEHQKQDQDRNQQLFLDPCGVVEICRISFGLYGTNPKYLQGMIRNIELQPQVFPGWVVRVYHDDSVTQEWLGKLEEAATQSQTTVEFISMSQSQIKGTIAGMFWRFLVADDGNVDRYIIRDSDSRLNLREKHAINEWIMSGKSAHNMRDHPSHANYIISGGMWGGDGEGHFCKVSSKMAQRLWTKSRYKIFALIDLLTSFMDNIDLNQRNLKEGDLRFIPVKFYKKWPIGYGEKVV